MSCEGSAFHETPNIDRIASQAMRFSNGYSACQVCSPSRAAIQTGKYPARVMSPSPITSAAPAAAISRTNGTATPGSCPRATTWK